MTTKKVSIRELVREGKKLNKYDFLDIEDEKSKEYQGVFVSYRYADEVKKFLKAKRRKKARKIIRFSGMATGALKNKTIQKIKSQKK